MNGTLAAVSGVALVCAIIFTAVHFIVSITRRSDLVMQMILAGTMLIAWLIFAIADFARGAAAVGPPALNVAIVLLSGGTFTLSALAVNLKGRKDGKR